MAVLRRHADASRLLGLFSVLVGLALLLPFLTTQSGWLEWANFYWLVEHQAESLRHLDRPSYFLSVDGVGLFYPMFMYYGATLFTIAGLLALLTGSAWVSFVTLIAIAGLMMYCGTWWMARQLGVDRLPAHLVGLAAITSPYYVTMLYGRGAWAEMIALSALPLAYAAAVSILAGRRRVLHLVVLLVAVVLATGSHNIALLWGSLFTLALVMAVTFALRFDVVSLVRRQWMPVVVVGALGVLVNAWFLLPDVVYGTDTLAYDDAPRWIDQLYWLDRANVVFHPGRFVPPESVAANNPDAYMQAPVYPLLWATAAGCLILLRGADRRLRRAWLAIAVMLGTLAILMIVNGAWDHLPRLLKTIQFPLRLHFFFILATLSLVIVGLLAVQKTPARRTWIAALTVAVLVQSAMSLDQAWSSKEHLSTADVKREAVPFSFGKYQAISYTSRERPVLARPSRRIVVEASDARDEVVAISGVARRGTRYALNVVYSPVVTVSGDARLLGRDADGYAVLSVDPPAGGGRWSATVREASPWPVDVGRLLSVLALLGVGLGAAAWLVRSRAS
jgi:hypothetical protein